MICLCHCLCLCLCICHCLLFGQFMSPHQMSQRSQVSRIAFWRYSQNVFVFVFVFVIVFVFVFVNLVMSCLLITLIKCLKGHKSLGSLCSVVKSLIVSLVGPTKGQTMSPNELFWTAKNYTAQHRYTRLAEVSPRSKKSILR